MKRLPHLKVVMEHITTMDAVKFVESCDDGMLSHGVVFPLSLLVINLFSICECLNFLTFI